MANRSGIVIGMAGWVIWDVGRVSCVLGMTLVCRALMKMMAATRMISIVTAKGITTGFMDESPMRCSGVGLLAVGFCTLMATWMPKPWFAVSWVRVIGCGLFAAAYSSR